MKRAFIIAALALLVSSCTSEVRRSQSCYATTPYDYSNLPPAEKGEEIPSVPTYANCPANVAEVLVRDERCTQWYGEEKFQRDYPKAGSQARRTTALRMMKDLRCDSIDDDIQRLKQQYQYDPAIQRALDNAMIDAVI